MKAFWKICALVLSAVLIIGCTDKDSKQQYIYGEEALSRLSSAMFQWHYKSAVSIADTLLSFPDDDATSEMKKIARGYKALSYIMLNQFDSVDNYIDELKEMLEKDTSLHYYNVIIGYTATGIYAIKRELDYTKAMSDFYKAMEVAETNKDTVNQVVSLCNIANVCLLRNDTSGLQYARRAYVLSRESNSYSSIVVSSALCLSNMMLLAKMYPEAIRYADTAGMYLGPDQLRHRCELELNRAQALSGMGRAEEAENLFNQVRDMILPGWADMLVKYRITYGEFLLHQKRFPQAVNELESALGSMGNSHENKASTYLLLSDAFSQAGNDKRSLEYYKLYHAYCDSLAVHEKEQQLNNMIRNMERIKYDKEIADRELEVVKANRNTLISVGAALACCIIAAVFWIMLNKTNRLYRKLVEQHQQYMLKENRLVERSRTMAELDPEDARDRLLFERLERLMDEGKSYRMKDISLNKLADMLSSNRAYVSKVINKFADQTFSTYINSKRINEAIAVLSDPDEDIPLKMLSDNLGYNTLSTFYRAFVKETGCPPSKYRSEMRHIVKK